MNRPDNLNDALRQLHNLTMAVAMETSNLMEATAVNPNHLESIKDTALDAHLLVTWIKDNIKEMHK